MPAAITSGLALNSVILAWVGGALLQPERTVASAANAIKRSIRRESMHSNTHCLITRFLNEFVAPGGDASGDDLSGTAVHGKDVTDQFANGPGAVFEENED